MKLLSDYIAKIQTDGAEKWSSRFEDEYGITMEIINDIAETEMKDLEKACAFDPIEDKIRVAIVGGLFLGLASMMIYNDEINDFAKELDEFGMEEQ